MDAEARSGEDARVRLALTIALCVFPAIAHAQVAATDPAPAPAELPGGDVLPPESHVTPPASPTHVGIGLHVQSLNHVDPPSEIFPHFSASVLLTLRWTDPRLAFDEAAEGAGRRVYQGPDAQRQLREIWHPDIGFENEDGERHTDGRTLAIRADGTVIYEELISTTFRARVRLHRFPFDTQRFHIAAQSVTWNVNKVVLEVLNDKTGFRDGNQRGSLEWQVRSLEHQLVRAEAVRSGHPHARAAFFLIAERSPGFYLWKLILPLLVIVVFTWSCFWMTGEAAGTRLQRAFIALLSVVAYQRVVADHLPRIPYLTWMDAMVYLAFAFTGATGVQIIITHKHLSANEPERAARIDRISRWAFPTSFVFSIAALSIYYAMS